VAFQPRWAERWNCSSSATRALPVMVFPTSGGRFYEFEDRGMIAALAGKIDAGQLQVYCVDSVDMESWYNRAAPPRWRIARHMQYEEYLIHRGRPLVRGQEPDPHLFALGCSFGGYHAVNIALRHPDIFTGMLSMSGAFDLSNFLDGYYDQDCYYNLPTHYLPNLSDPWFFDLYRRNTTCWPPAGTTSAWARTRTSTAS
jgi:esterase/lipase superfamily enzyme